MPHFLVGGTPASLVEVQVGKKVEVQLWGDGPAGKPLDVVPSAPVVQVEEVLASVAAGVRTFNVRGLRQGSARLWGRDGPTGRVWADTRVMVGRNGLNRYYHGTNSTVADLLTNVDLTPMTVPSPAMMSSDWTDYTDFGKGFYVHLEANKKMAYEWAKRRFSSDWAVVEFIATADELSDIAGKALRYENKTDRPPNSPHPVTVTTIKRGVEICPGLLPILFPCLKITEKETFTTVGKPMSWLEFVEYNRRIVRGEALIARPNDRDWTADYSSIRGPIWVPRDSGYPVGLPKFPDDLHQLNWGLAGMAMLNTDESKTRRFKFSSSNEGLFPPP